MYFIFSPTPLEDTLKFPLTTIATSFPDSLSTDEIAFYVTEEMRAIRKEFLQLLLPYLLTYKY